MLYMMSAEEQKVPTLVPHSPEFTAESYSLVVSMPLDEHNIPVTQMKVLKCCFNLKSDIYLLIK